MILEAEDHKAIFNEVSELLRSGIEEWFGGDEALDDHLASLCDEVATSLLQMGTWNNRVPKKYHTLATNLVEAIEMYTIGESGYNGSIFAAGTLLGICSVMRGV